MNGTETSIVYAGYAKFQAWTIRFSRSYLVIVTVPKTG